MYSLSLMVAAFLTVNGVTIATNCWQNSVILHYTVGPAVVTLQQSEANKIMNEVLSHVKTKLSCTGLSLTLIKVTIATPGNQYAITGTYGVMYGNMDSSQKQTASTCLGHAQIYNDIVRNPDQYTSPLSNKHLVDRSTISSFSDTTCCTSGLVLVNSVCVAPPSVSLTSSMMQNSTQTIALVQTIYQNLTMSSTVVLISSSPTINHTLSTTVLSNQLAPPSVSLTSSMMQNSTQTIALVQTIYQNLTMSSTVVLISSSPTINHTLSTTVLSNQLAPPSVSLTSSMMQNSTQTIALVQTIYQNLTMSSTVVLISSSPTINHTLSTTVLSNQSSVAWGTTSSTTATPASPWSTSSITATPASPSTTPITTSSTTALPTTAAPWIALLKCYTMDLTLLYTIPKNLSTSKLNPSFLKVTLIVITSGFLPTIASCKSVELYLYSTNLSRIHDAVVSVRVALKFSVKSPETPASEVERTLTTCLGSLRFNYPSLLQNLSMPLTVGFTRYEKQSIEVHSAASCCGDGIKLPCCPSNSIKQSKTSCAPLYFADYIQSKRLRIGSTIMASCAVVTQAQANLKVSWKRNKETLSSSGTAFNYTLLINKVGTSDAGVYQCEVQNDFQVITKPFLLQVVVSDKVEMRLTLAETFHSDLLNETSQRYITLHQQFITQMEIVLRKQLKDFEKIEVLRFSKGSVVVDFKVYLEKTLSSPVPSPPDLQSEVISVMINQAQRGIIGNLTVNSLALKVKPPPPFNIKVTDRGTTHVTLSWQPPLGWQSYQITKYNIRYRIDNQVQWKTIEVPSDRNSLRIDDLNTNTKYQFQMVSRSTLGVGKPSILVGVTTLTVHPIIANNGQNFTATVGQTVVLVCQGSSSPRPDKVTWTRKAPTAEFYTNVTGNGKIVNRYMVVHNVSVDDSGSYGCSALYKDVTTTGAVNLIVNVPVAVNMNITLTKMDFTEELKNKSSPEFQKLSTRFVSTVSILYENITGFQGIEVLGFEKGSVKVSFRVIIVVKIDNPKAKIKQSTAKASATNLIIKQVQNNNGELGDGLIVNKDSIQTDAPPNPPRNVSVSDVKETVAHLAWTKPEYAEFFSVTHYTVKLKKHGDQFTWDEKVTTSYVQLDSPLNNLQEGTGYNVKVVARSGGRNGLESKQTEFVTDSKETSLLWLWIVIPIVIILGIMITAIVWHRYRKNTDNNNDNHNVDGHDDNANTIGSHYTQMYQSDIRLCSYKNFAVSLPSLEISSLGIMPGKWWEITRESLTLGDVLGSGAFGLVRKAQLDTGDRSVTCAVKMLKKMASEEEGRDLIQEMEIMNSVGRHGNLVNLIGACTHNGPILIILEFAEKGSLLDYIQHNVTSVNGDKVCSLADGVKLNIGLDIAKGMQHLANVKCVHRDLAARNVLLTGSGQAKISDFGLSRDIYECGFYEKKSQGKLPVRWMAPETITKMLFTIQSDVWSYGVVLWEIETGGKVPYAGIGGLELVNHLSKGCRLVRPGSCKEDVYNIMVDCWNINPDARPSFDELRFTMEELLSHQSHHKA